MMMQRHAAAMSQYASMSSADNRGMSEVTQNSPAPDGRGEDHKQNVSRPQGQDGGGALETDRLRSWDDAAREHVQQHYQGQMRSQQQQGEMLQRMRGGGMLTGESGGMSPMVLQQMHQQMMRQQQMQMMMSGGMVNGGMGNNMQGRPEGGDKRNADSATKTEGGQNFVA